MLFQKLRTKDPTEKVSDFLVSHYLNQFFCLMEDVKLFALLVSFFLVAMVVEGTDSLLSPKGVNYEGFTFPPFLFFPQ